MVYIRSPDIFRICKKAHKYPRISNPFKFLIAWIFLEPMSLLYNNDWLNTKKLNSIDCFSGISMIGLY